MRFHVLGLGPVGQLVAFHLRRSLSPKHVVCLMFKSRSLARRMCDYPLHVEYEGIVNSVAGFQMGSTLSAAGSEQLSKPQEAEEEDQSFPPEGSARGTVVPSVKSQRSTSVSNEPDNAEEKHIESLFVTCKAQSTLSAIKQLDHRLSPESTIVLLQNGNLAAHELLLGKVFTDANKRPNFILVSNTHGVWLKRAPFHIVHAGIGRLRFGIVPDGRRDFEKGVHARDYTNGKTRLNLDNIAFATDDPEVARYRSLRNTVAVLQKLSGLHSTWEPFSSMQVVLRQKLAVNCVINPLTAILGCRNGELFEHEAGKRLAYRVCKEAARVFRKEAVANRHPETLPAEVYVPPELSLGGLMHECERVAKVTESNTSSMLADLKKGKKMTEIEYLNGYLLTLGSRYNESMTVNASLLDLVKMRTEIPLDTML